MSPTAAPESSAGARAPLRWREMAGIGLFLLASTTAMEFWQARRDAQWAPTLARAAQPGDIRMLSSQTCVYCTRARDWLRDAGVPVQECFIERDAACAAEYRALGAGGTPLVVVRGEPQLGFSPQRVAERLAAVPQRSGV